VEDVNVPLRISSIVSENLPTSIAQSSSNPCDVSAPLRFSEIFEILAAQVSELDSGMGHCIPETSRNEDLQFGSSSPRVADRDKDADSQQRSNDIVSSSDSFVNGPSHVSETVVGDAEARFTEGSFEWDSPSCSDVVTYNSAISACESLCQCIRVDPWGERDLEVDLLGVAPPTVDGDVDVITYKSAISACDESGVSSLVKSGRSCDSAALPQATAVNGDHGDAVKDDKPVTHGGSVSPDAVVHASLCAGALASQVEVAHTAGSESCPESDNVNFLDVIYEVVALLSKDTEGNPVPCWIEIEKVVAAARSAHVLSAEAVYEIIVCWEELEVMSLNPDKSMVKFVVPFFSPE